MCMHILCHIEGERNHFRVVHKYLQNNKRSLAILPSRRRFAIVAKENFHLIR